MRDIYNYEPSRNMGPECLMLILLMAISAAFGWIMATILESQYRNQDNTLSPGAIQFFSVVESATDTTPFFPISKSDTLSDSLPNIYFKKYGAAWAESTFVPRMVFRLIIKTKLPGEMQEDKQ